MWLSVNIEIYKVVVYSIFIMFITMIGINVAIFSFISYEENTV